MYIYMCSDLTASADRQVTLFPLPDLSPPTALAKAKDAFCFAIHTVVRHVLSDGKALQPSDSEFGRSGAVPTVITYLVVGCRRKVVIYSWRDGEPQEVKVIEFVECSQTRA